ncbi:MAG TPA: single-stranded DNA-binding protein, partial [Pseudomonas sp.]|nr:single-stranded DNA-binding protein [Pseudomonas sp.]
VVDMNGTMQLLGSRGGSSDDAPRQPRPQREPQQAPRQQAQPQRQAAPQPAPDYDSFDDDIPF